MMTKKNLAKAVTLSVLLMLPYGMVQAETTYTEAISGADDKYTEPQKTYNNSTNTYTYTLVDGAVLDLETYYNNTTQTLNFNTIGINAENENIVISGAIDIKMQKGEEKFDPDVLYGISTKGSNSMLDMREGANLEIIGGNSAVQLNGTNNKIYLGNGNITLTNTDNSYDIHAINLYGGNISGDEDNLLVYGTGIITNTSTINKDLDLYNKLTGVHMDGNASGNDHKIILGYHGNYNDSDFEKFNDVDNLKDTVKNLGSVEINVTATNTSQNNDREATATGIDLEQAGEKSENTAYNIIAAGDVIIKAEATSAGSSDYYTLSKAQGLNAVSSKKNVTNVIAVKSADITVVATNEQDAAVEATGIIGSSYKSNANTLIEVAEKSTVNVTANSNGNVSVAGIKTISNQMAEGYLFTYGNDIVNTADIDITTNSTGGTVENVGIKTSGGNVTVNGAANISANASGAAEGSKVYGLWSTIGGNITINGTTTISTTGGQDIAVVAGTEGWDEESADFKNPLGGTNNINLNYGAGSNIKGDIISGYGGNITIGNADGISTLSTRNNAGTLNLTGDALSANGGKLSINLTSGSTWTGRADDYQDADLASWADKHEEQFNPKFSHDIAASGDVSVNLAQGATWNVTGQSWISELNGNGVVDLTKAEGSDAVHIGKVSGNNTFIVNLKPGDGLSTSDMLYIADGTSDAQTLQIYNREEVLNGMGEGDRIRFATVAKAGEGFGNVTDGAATFGRSTRINDAGIFNVDFKVEYVDYKTDTEKDDDHAYNGGANFTDSEAKPGTDYVDSVYGSVDGAQNVYLVRDKVTEANKSDAAKTIINMSKVNYNNAIYMDRLNKRLGEARYISPEDEQGMWVRIRHDRIGKDDAFRSQNTMYEMGYDVKQDCDNGERRVGMAIDYMDGKAEYTGIAGDGDVKRYGLWLYDTWLGDKGHYTDYVLKWGHLENDFDIMARTTGEKITGDYSNNVFSASAEYGKKNDMGGGWYFEPQAQLQFARVTGADYVTSQDTKVSLDGINSLIGRAGFRLGRDLNENSTVYVKADLLHEFLGDQDITATDITGTLREEYENKGTWYDVGFGFATALGKSSYAFMDFEKSFGNDNDETYQINAGVQWTF